MGRRNVIIAPRTNHFNRVWLLIACIWLTAIAGVAYSRAWRVTPGALPPTILDRLNERYPQINNPQQLEELLRDIGRRHPSIRLDAYLEGDIWVIDIATAPLVAAIEIDLVARFLKTPLYSVVQNYIGQVDSPEIRKKIDKALQNYVRKRGFPQNKISMTPETDKSGVTYNYKIVEGEPCLLDKVEIGFTLPDRVTTDIKAGAICDEEEIEAGITLLENDLRDAGYTQLKLELADLAYHPENNTASAYISGILGQRIRYEIKDLSKRFLIDDLFTDDELTNVDPTIVGPDAMAVELARRYRNRGFADAEVSPPTVSKTGDDQFIYRYDVNPGTQYFLKNIAFEGATVFSTDELLETMGLKSLWQSARPLNLEEIQESLNAVRARYQQAGYWDFKARDPGPGQREKETGQARLIIQLNEGRQRLLRELKIKGNVAISSSEIEAMLSTAIGSPLDRGKLVDFQQSLRTAYVSQGFRYVDVKIDLDAAPQKKTLPTTVNVLINEGTRVKIGDITITGLVRTHAKVVKRELLFATGDWYEPEKLSASQRALTRLGLFRSVQITPSDRHAVTDKEPEIDLQVDVREGKAGNVSFGPRWNLERGWGYGTEASYNNLSGVGRQVSIRAAISEEKQQHAIGARSLLGRKIGTGFLEPYIFSWPVDASIALNQRAEAIGSGDLWDLTYGGEVALSHKLRVFLPGSVASVFYGQKISRSEGVPQKEEDLVATNVRIGRTGIRYNIDERDNLRFPLQGYTLDSELAWARYQLGGNLRYFYWEFTHNRYFKITDNWVFALSMAAASYDDVERRGDLIGILPPTERLYAGGSDTVRGYPLKALGPSVRGPTFDENSGQWDCGYQFSPLGGNRRTTVKTELRHRINDILATTGFIDSGNAFFSKDQFEKFASNYNSPYDEDVIANPACPDPLPENRSVQGNVGYEYSELARHPNYLVTKHYLAYGASLNLLTAIGAVNFAYGLPWREPKTAACQNDQELCDSKISDRKPWILKGSFHINIGANF